MTDKQIIIDDKKYCILENDDIGLCVCKHRPCEQLKRKEQECERLDSEAQNLFTEKTNLEIELDQLKAEIEELKKVSCKFKDYCTCDTEKLKQTLTEIREIAENREIFCENCGGGVESFTCDDCGYVKILQKISEVEDVEINYKEHLERYQAEIRDNITDIQKKNV